MILCGFICINSVDLNRTFIKNLDFINISWNFIE